VAVQHDGAAPVFLRPRVPHRQAVLVGLARGLPVQAELADPAGRAAVVALDQARVGHHQAPAVQHVVADQAVDEPVHLGPELLGLERQLLHRRVQAVAAPDVLAAQRLEQLDLVVADHAERGPGGHHAHDQAQHPRRVGSPVDQVAEEDRAAVRVARADRPTGAVALQGVAELGEQLLELGQAAVHVADDVERAAFVPQVAVQPGAGDRDRVDLVLAAQHVHGAEPLAAQPVQAAAQLAALAADHVRAEVAVLALCVPVRAEFLRQVQDDRHRQHVVLAGHRDQLAAGFWLHVGRVHHGEPAACQALAHDIPQQVERGRRGGLVVLVVGDQAPAEVRGDDLGRLEVRAGERRLARPGDADQHHQAQLGDGQLPGHFAGSLVKTASWVGGPASGCSWPTGRKRAWY
jgi:hypothetical protein